MNSNDAAALLRRTYGTPGGEHPSSIVSRGLIDPKTNKIALTVNAKGQFVDGEGRIVLPNLKEFYEDFVNLDTTDQVALILPTGAAASTATGTINHVYTPAGNVLCVGALGAGQTIAPSIVAAGLSIGGDQTDDEGYELFSHFIGATGRPFIIGLDPAFYFRCKFTVGDVSGIDTLLCGFRRAAVLNGTYTSIADYAALGWSTGADPAAIKILTGLNGTDTATDTTNTIADGIALTVEVKVSATGVVTYRHDAVTPGTLKAPTTTAALTLDNGDPVIPFFHFLNTAALGDTVTIQSWEVGFQ